MTDCPHPEKHAHPSKRAALVARTKLERVRGIDIGLKPYLCNCGAWHLGHRTKDPVWARKIRKNLK